MYEIQYIDIKEKTTKKEEITIVKVKKKPR